MKEQRINKKAFELLEETISYRKSQLLKKNDGKSMRKEDQLTKDSDDLIGVTSQKSSQSNGGYSAKNALMD